MRPEPLFIRRCEQLVLLIQSHDEVEVLDIAGILRLLLVDKHSLVDTVNTNKIQLLFHVGVLPPFLPSLMDAAFYSLDDGIDPETAMPGTRTVLLTRGEFLNHSVMLIRGEYTSIKDVIKFASNVAGGIHHDPNPKEEYRDLHTISNQFWIGGLPAGIKQIKAIGRVVLRGLAPIGRDVLSRRA